MKQSSPAPEDTIVTLGDYINRGPDNRGVIEKLVELKDRCRLVSLLGNHENILFEALADRYRLDDLICTATSPKVVLKVNGRVPGLNTRTGFAMPLLQHKFVVGFFR